MNFPSIDIQGSILSTDLLSKIRSEQASFQSGKDFRADFTNAKLKDEISFAWQEAKGQWTIYKSKLARLRSGELGTTETRNFWISPLLTNLGYNLTFNRQAEELNGKSFSIGYRDTTLDGFPIYAGGYHESLDKRPENKQIRMSPHALVQEYLNYSEHLYGIVTNGRQLRLLRDASRITRLSYVEFNLEKMMEEDLYSDFVLLYRLLHSSRMPRTVSTESESIIEQYHQEALEAGSTIRSKLGEAVKAAIKDLANGFVNNQNNTELLTAIRDDKLNANEYYRLQLRIIYRLLFLFVIEERNLVYAHGKTNDTKRFSDIYFKYFSLMRIRKIAKNILPPESDRHFDLWKGLVSTFSLFEKEHIGKKLGIMSLQGDLFSYNSLTTSTYDLHQCDVSNAVILNIIRSLSYFENDNGVLIAVNYGGLDVEEFGSVYEGLLELELELKLIEGTNRYSVDWRKKLGGREFQSHYTPEELVQPLIKHSLDYLIADKLKERDPASALLSLKIADVACGSGHILLSAARRIAHELASIMETQDSGGKEKVEQPSPAYVRRALKDVIRNCIYGVDKNPLAVELCKVALWLEAYNPGEPLSFLDHHIKCGDAIVGLAHRNELEKGIPDEAFLTLPGDDKEIAKTFRETNAKERKEREAKSLQLKADFEKDTKSWVQETMVEYKSFTRLPEFTPEEIERKAKAYQKFIDGRGFTFLKALADTQVAQFFIHKSEQNNAYLMTDGHFRMILSGYNKSWQDRRVAKANAVAREKTFFHWFLEFPEVFERNGFDCVLGNPPYLGDKKQKKTFGENYLQYIKYQYDVGINDLVVYFFLRIFDVTKPHGFESLLTTSSISQGDMRKGALEGILSKGGAINFAIKSMKWPGIAKLNVALVSFKKGKITNETIVLNGREESYISTFLSSEKQAGEPFALKRNEDKIFIGYFYNGDGFLLTNEKANEIIQHDKKYRDVVAPFINGDDLNDSPEQTNSRSIINFSEKPLNKKFDLSQKRKVGPPYAEEYPLCLAIVEKFVKPERQRWKKDENGIDIVGTYELSAALREKWWLFERSRPGLRAAISKLTHVFVTAQTTKYLNFVLKETDYAFSQTTFVVASDDFAFFAILQSCIHFEWSVKYGNSKGDTFRYAPSACFENFPFAENLTLDQRSSLTAKGKALHTLRRDIMALLQLGLTKAYNLFHSKNLTIEIIENESKMTHDVCIQALEWINNLRILHQELDNEVLQAYGWSDIDLNHDFYEIGYLRETDNVRFCISELAKRQILTRLLELNHKLHDEELKAGLWDKKKVDIKTRKGSTVNEPEVGYGSLFNS